MLHEILAFFKTYFADTAQRDIDQYITSKNPTSACEVDYWVRQYDLTQNKRSWL